MLIPINAENRKDISEIQLTNIGQFGLIRKSRNTIKEHYHTGIDIKRPTNNLEDEPIYPISEGIVISKRTDGPYANLIIEHIINGKKIWSLYEHIAGIRVSVRDVVNPSIPIARFMNKEELDNYGWQFNHFHLEILKESPLLINADHKHPERFYISYSLKCYTITDLEKYYHHPIIFLRQNIH